MLRFRFVVVLMAAVAAALPASARQFDASATGGPTQLDAPWRLHFGEDAAFAQPGFDDSLVYHPSGEFRIHRGGNDAVLSESPMNNGLRAIYTIFGQTAIRRSSA
jgi:hypothetical protein